MPFASTYLLPLVLVYSTNTKIQYQQQKQQKTILKGIIRNDIHSGTGCMLNVKECVSFCRLYRVWMTEWKVFVLLCIVLSLFFACIMLTVVILLRNFKPRNETLWEKNQ